MGFKRRIIQIKSIADKGPVGRAVLAITGMSGVLCGIMSQSPTFMMMPYGTSFQEMWIITLNGAIRGFLEKSPPFLKFLTISYRTRRLGVMGY
jgi:hypothetical protein